MTIFYKQDTYNEHCETCDWQNQLYCIINEKITCLWESQAERRCRCYLTKSRAVTEGTYCAPLMLYFRFPNPNPVTVTEITWNWQSPQSSPGILPFHSSAPLLMSPVQFSASHHITTTGPLHLGFTKCWSIMSRFFGIPEHRGVLGVAC